MKNTLSILLIALTINFATAQETGLKIGDFAPELAVDVIELESFNHWAEGIDSPILLWESEPSQVAKDSFPKNVQHIFDAV